MIQAEGDPLKRDEYLQKLMELPNQVTFLHHEHLNEYLNYKINLDITWNDKIGIRCSDKLVNDMKVKRV